MRDRCAHRVEVVEAAAEAALLGQHADGGRAPALVRRGQGSRVGDAREVALAGAAALHLGDHRGARAPERRQRVAGRRHVEQPGAQLALGDLRLPPGQVFAHARDDVVEHGHDQTSRASGRASGIAAKPLTRPQPGLHPPASRAGPADRGTSALGSRPRAAARRPTTTGDLHELRRTTAAAVAVRRISLRRARGAEQQQGHLGAGLRHPRPALLRAARHPGDHPRASGAGGGPARAAWPRRARCSGTSRSP